MFIENVLKQPGVVLYVIMTAPAPTPVTKPVVVLIVARAVFELSQVPPDIACVSVVVLPTHKLAEPDIVVSAALTVTVVVEKQPDAPNLYEITAVPAETPVTKPVLALIVATAALLVLQVPPEVALANVAVEPTQSVVLPVMAASDAETVTIAVRTQPVVCV
jgi:type III secretory pathway component EscR